MKITVSAHFDHPSSAQFAGSVLAKSGIKMSSMKIIPSYSPKSIAKNAVTDGVSSAMPFYESAQLMSIVNQYPSYSSRLYEKLDTTMEIKTTTASLAELRACLINSGAYDILVK